MITNYLPTFKILEVNNLTGLRNGHMLSQFPANASITKVQDGKFIENGLIVGLDNDGTINNFNKANHDTMFVHYTEELNTFLDEAKYFAVEVEDEVAYPRCIALYVGDTFTTNNVASDVPEAKYAKVSATGVLELQTEADNDSAFIAKETTLANGSKAWECTMYRMPLKA